MKLKNSKEISDNEENLFKLEKENTNEYEEYYFNNFLKLVFVLGYVDTGNLYLNNDVCPAYI